MKKLFSSIIIVMMIALAFTLVASAEAKVYTPDADGLYEIEYAVTADDDTQFGMVVIEATGDEAFVLDEATIRYIDQVGAADNKISFDAFAPMDLKNEGTYKVYIGGGELDEATFIGTLSTEAAPTPTVKTVEINEAAPTVEEGKTVALTATVTDADATYTLAWASDATDVATVDAATGVVTGVKAGTANITVTAAAGVTDTVVVTVTEAQQGGGDEPDTGARLGDVDGDEELTTTDAYMVVRYAIGYEVADFNADVCDIDADEEPTTTDAYMIVRKAIGYSVAELDAVWPEL